MKFNKDDIETILENSVFQPSLNYIPELQDEVVEDLKSVEFVNSHVNSLRKLYVQLPPLDKKRHVAELLKFLEYNERFSVPLTAFNALVHLGYFDKAIGAVIVNFANYNYGVFNSQIINLLSTILKYEWNILTRDQINELYVLTKNALNNKNISRKSGSVFYSPSLITQLQSLYRRLNIIKMMALKEQIFVGTNYEINSDKAALTNEFKKLNFPDDLTETLNKIDLNISMANDNFDLKDAMGLIRSFTERLFKYIAIKLDENKGKSMDEKDSEKTATFFIQKGLISEEQGKLLIALRHFLSNEGVHRLKSRPDDARLSKNMTIELCLYLVLRLNDIALE